MDVQRAPRRGKGRPRTGDSAWDTYIEAAEFRDGATFRALALLAREARARGLTIASVAEESGREPIAFSRTLLNAKNPRPTIIEDFANVLGYNALIVRALLDTLSERDERSAMEQLAQVMGDRGLLFKTGFNFYFIVRDEILKLDGRARGEILSNFLIANAGLSDKDAFEVLADNFLRTSGFDLRAHYANDTRSRYLQAFAGFELLAEALALPADVRLRTQDVLRPYLGDTSSWLHEEEQARDAMGKTYEARFHAEAVDENLRCSKVSPELDAARTVLLAATDIVERISLYITDKPDAGREAFGAALNALETSYDNLTEKGRAAKLLRREPVENTDTTTT